MRQLVTAGLLWCSAIGCGVIAGVYFAFSTFIMTALAHTGPGPGIAAMNAINVEIVKSLFMPLFLVTTLTSAALAVIACIRLSEPGAPAMLAGGVLYVLGMFIATSVFNVPLNDALAAADPSSAEGAALWTRYLSDWTLWNHVRTGASLAATVLFTMALAAR
jgi:uncharacterized membrane protein